MGSRLLGTLLAHVALSPGRPVAVDALVDGLWGERLPQRPTAALQVQVTRLRKILGPDLPLVSRHGGYVLEVADDEVDLRRFHRLSAAARTADDPDETVEIATAALALWDEPFAGCVPGARLEMARVEAHERFLRLLEAHATALLKRDAPSDAAAAADALLPHLPAHRDREGLVALAMTALHRLGRTVDALAVYAETRRVLRTEHGVDPGAPLRELEQLLLAAPRRSPTREQPVVGREDLLAAIRGRLDDPDRGWLLIVTGEAGIGKTSLLRAARAEARLRGAAVGAGTWDEVGSPLAAWTEGFRGLGVVPPAPGEPELGRTIRRVLAARADDVPLLLTLDDAHRADSASRGALLALARLGLPPGVVLLAAAREPDAVAHPAWEDTRADLVRHPGVAELPVGALDARAVAALLALRHAPPDAGSVPDLLARSAGVPLHLVALLDLGPGTAGRVPDRLRPLLAHQLGQLPAPCREVLEALAVLAPIDVDALATTLETTPRAVIAALRPAVDLGLVVPDDGSYVLRHELLAVAARERVPEPERALLHRTRLDTLPDDVDPFERLRHAVGAGALVPAAVVSDARLDAARTARRRGAFLEALALLDQADTASAPAEVAVLRGVVLEALGRTPEADDVLDVVAADRSVAPDLRADAAVGVDALGMSIAGRPRRLARLQQVRGLELDDRQRVRTLRALIEEQLQLLGDAEADAMPELLALAARRPDDPRLQAQVALLRVNQLADEPVPVADRLRHARRACDLGARSDDTELELEAEELLVAALIAAGQVDEADRQRTALGVAAERLRHARGLWACLLIEASTQLARGEVELAMATADAARDRGADLGIPDALGAYGVHLASHHLLAGTMPSLGGLPAMAAGFYPHVAAWASVAAVDAVQGGDRDAAEAHLAEWHRRRRGRPYRLFDRPGLCLAAAAAFALDDAASAREVLVGMPADPGAVVVVGVGAGILGPLETYRGLALLALDSPEEAHRSFTAAASMADRLGWRPWADAASRLTRFVADGTSALPFGLRRL
ncbi:hypothetical protein GCM10023201_33510 [Actinomycetospora corticicola]|uniref:DNA-binding SARP family transcriptional activator n=1 Tax=Actinomycetospora corticicola TaxID=663602 RepID=A0A7Y9J3Z6_9PSEU|nr:BTAD domain-containing putative transcriptional regulator [Actinomycetospora corticicola]NYD34525.1 DNA-binding SARP family transcriptional activator [Actinomycetospora corticicola]